MLRVAINGFGRIGRNVLRALYESNRRDEIQVVAINELASPAGILHLLRYDTAHGRFEYDSHLCGHSLVVDGDHSIVTCGAH